MNTPFLSAMVPALTVNDGRTFEIPLAVSQPSELPSCKLIADLYYESDPNHPSGHLGWWAWSGAVLGEQASLQISLDDYGQISLNHHASEDQWVNPNLHRDSRQTVLLHLVLRSKLNNTIIFDDVIPIYADPNQIEENKREQQRLRNMIEPHPGVGPWYSWPQDMRVFVATTSFNERDAIGRFVLGLSSMFQRNDIECQLLADAFPKKLRGMFWPLRYLEQLARPNDLLIYNYSIADSSFEALKAIDIRKVMYYHNITPEKYFRIYDAEFAQFCQKGREQLRDINAFDLVITNSNFTRQEVESIWEHDADSQQTDSTKKDSKLAENDSAETPRILPLPGVVSNDTNRSIRRNLPTVEVAPPSVRLDHLATVTGKPMEMPPYKTRLLHVGRLAPHKCIEDLLHSYHEFYKLDPDSALIIVGQPMFETYIGVLQCELDKFPPEVLNHVYVLTDVDDQRLRTIYEGSTAYLSMSEHEGFCLPLVEAMHFKLPVFSYAQPCMSETLGGAGGIIHEKHFPSVARFIHGVLNNKDRLACMIDRQNDRVAELLGQGTGQKLIDALETVIIRHARAA